MLRRFVARHRLLTPNELAAARADAIRRIASSVERTRRDA
jgi:hypothetical protein